MSFAVSTAFFDTTPATKVAIAVAAIVVGLAAVFLPVRSADAALLDRVNEAIRASGAPTTVERSAAFQEGVYIGHYTTFDQLVGAIAYHRAKGTLPTFTRTQPVTVTRCITGDVISFSDVNIGIRGDVTTDVGTDVATKNIKIAANQYKVALARGVGRGSNVTVCSADNFASQYGHATRN